MRAGAARATVAEPRTRVGHGRSLSAFRSCASREHFRCRTCGFERVPVVWAGLSTSARRGIRAVVAGNGKVGKFSDFSFFFFF